MHILSVTVHAARAAESLAAIRTRVRKLARVLPHVDVQPVLMNEPEEKIVSSSHRHLLRKCQINVSRSGTVLTLVRLGAHVRLEVLVEGTFVAHGLFTDGTHVRVILSLVDLAVALEAVVGGEGSATQLALELLEAAVQFDVVLQRQDRLHLLAAQVTHVVTFAWSTIYSLKIFKFCPATSFDYLRESCCCEPAALHGW